MVYRVTVSFVNLNMTKYIITDLQNSETMSFWQK